MTEHHETEIDVFAFYDFQQGNRDDEVRAIFERHGGKSIGAGTDWKERDHQYTVPVDRLKAVASELDAAGFRWYARVQATVGSLEEVDALLAYLKTAQDFQTQEQRCRRLAKRQGFSLSKSKARSPEDPTWQQFLIVNNETGFVEFGQSWLNLDEVERFLTEGHGHD